MPVPVPSGAGLRDCRLAQARCARAMAGAQRQLEGLPACSTEPELGQGDTHGQKSSPEQ